MIFIALGMHKSGTTLLSRILHESGISMIEEPIQQADYDSGQVFERHTVVKINKEMLNWGSLSSLDVIPSGPVVPSPQQWAEMRAMIQACEEQHPNWGFKDPRCCLTYESWAAELPPHKIVAIYRSYREVLEHYRFHSFMSYPFHKLRKALKAWIYYNERLVAVLRATESPVMILRYEDLMTSETEFRRLSRFVGCELTDLRNPKLYRNRTQGEESLPFLTRKIVETLPRHPQDVLAQLNDLAEENRARSGAAGNGGSRQELSEALRRARAGRR